MSRSLKFRLTKLVILFCCFLSASYAQNDSAQFIRKGLVRADASIVGGYMFLDNISNVHINGSAEYYFDNLVSVRGSASTLLGSSGLTADSMGLKDFHSIYIGPVFHIQTKNHFDPYLVIQPGLSYTSSYQQIKQTVNGLNRVEYAAVVSPIASVGVGFNYYFQRYVHLFGETRYVYGRHLSEAPSPISLQELRITFGLGFNIFTQK
ncbi:MAG: hypothetical protein H0X46_04830 [Bacteroidetes bacterium]|nr:hypothetical protein [Bacteroidota bacterium]